VNLGSCLTSAICLKQQFSSGNLEQKLRKGVGESPTSPWNPKGKCEEEEPSLTGKSSLVEK